MRRRFFEKQQQEGEEQERASAQPATAAGTPPSWRCFVHMHYIHIGWPTGSMASLEEVQAMIEARVAPLEAQVAVLTNTVEALQRKLRLAEDKAVAVGLEKRAESLAAKLGFASSSEMLGSEEVCVCRVRPPRSRLNIVTPSCAGCQRLRLLAHPPVCTARLQRPRAQLGGPAEPGSTSEERCAPRDAGQRRRAAAAAARRAARARSALRGGHRPLGQRSPLVSLAAARICARWKSATPLPLTRAPHACCCRGTATRAPRSWASAPVWSSRRASRTTRRSRRSSAPPSRILGVVLAPPAYGRTPGTA